MKGVVPHYRSRATTPNRTRGCYVYNNDYYYYACGHALILHVFIVMQIMLSSLVCTNYYMFLNF